MTNDTGSFNHKNHVTVSLGARIRALRNKRNMKISDLSALTGLTSSTISQVERAIISPSIATLKKICDAMNIPIGYLFANDATEECAAPEMLPDKPSIDNFLKLFPAGQRLAGSSPVVHRENRKFLSPGQGIRFYLLNPDLSGPLEMIYNEYDPGTSTGPPLYTHPGSECGVILSGQLTVQINETAYVLQEGDSITFQSAEPHLKKNDSDVLCTCIWANVPPWF
jgi:transcriptional regulator with XRE-family HTH domain